jgi:TPP-dependent pyruvate/acetoin dehydrogenase alpha subunit
VDTLPGWNHAQLIAMLERMLLIRAFDSCLPNLYTQGLVRGSAHAATGQEAVAVGGCFALQPDDYITSTHRGHGHAIAKGADPKRMMAELLGRTDGYCRGKGGSMHIADFSIGMLGANGIVGGGFGIAAGAALTASLLKTGLIALCFFGDGAINEGSFLEVGNLAAIWRLPVIFLCENNQFAMSARPEQMTSPASLVDRAVGLGIPGVRVDGTDVLAVYEAVQKAAVRVRAREGPSLIVADCYRFLGHFSGDALKYRDKKEVEPWLARDPIALFSAGLTGAQILTSAELAEMSHQAEMKVEDALEFARASPMPDASEAWEDLYA